MRLCVFCGSHPGHDVRHAKRARQVGRAVAQRGAGLVYGGGALGLMGEVADAALAAGGEVLGVIPRSLVAREVAHRDLSELHVVETMHERKALMAELSDGFLTLPGGLGTLDELFESWTWAVLGYHDKPVGLLDGDGYWAPLLTLIEHAMGEGFVAAAHRDRLEVGDDPDELVGRLLTRDDPAVGPRLAGGPGGRPPEDPAP